ncbi:serine/threonine-protein kinase [Paenarthrobacter sp. NPDC089322]|uniref:serine/threonine-protein kinase n=1 Tax=Paenarthrobacter sp. NPDC089322 TaxID=3155065 RepID=UPI003449F450
MPVPHGTLTVPVPHAPGYELTRLLGQGATSMVWLATRNTDGHRVAVKCLGNAPDSGSDSAGILSARQAAREGRILATLQHDHLVKVHDVVMLGAGGGFGVVMDYAAGGSLANLMGARGRLGIGETVTILTPVAQALAYLHSQGTVHGDISPGNVLFTAEGKPLVGDFGVALAVGGAHDGYSAGTPGFVDPSAQGMSRSEVLQPQRDVYSVAALGWYCLTGMVPETAKLRPPLSLLVPGIPKGLAAALEAGLDPDIHVRPTARELAKAIYRSAPPQPVDLAGSVHPSVIPELLTRREAGGRSQPGCRSLGTVLHRWRRSLLTLPRLPRKWRLSRKRELTRGHRLPRKDKALALLFSAVAVLLAVSVAALWQANLEDGSAAGERRVGVREVTMVGNKEQHGIPEAMSAALHSEDPLVAVPALSAVRDLALGHHRLELLALVNAPGSPAEAADLVLIRQLEADGTLLAGLVTNLSAVTVLGDPAGGQVVVGLTVQTSSYEERDASHTLLRSNPAGTAREMRLVLVRAEGTWKLSEILPPA